MKPGSLIRSSGFRISAYYTIAFVASMLLLLASLYWTVSSALEQQIIDSVEAEMQSLVETHDTEGTSELLRDIAEKRWISPQVAGAYFFAMEGVDPSGNVKIATRFEGWRTLTSAEIAYPDSNRADTDDDHQFMGLGRILADGGYLFVGADIHRMLTVQEDILEAFGWTAGFGLLLAVVGGVVLSRNIRRRIDVITLASVAIMQGDLKQRIPVRGTTDELDRLAASLNDMLDRIQALMESLKHVSSNIAHDLRTPLSHLRQELESALMRGKNVEDYREAIEGSIVEADNLLATFAALLRIANIESGTRGVGFGPVPLQKLFSDVAQAYGPVAEESGRPFTTEFTADAMIEGDAELLTQMLANIVLNAMRHTPAGSSIHMALREDDGAIVGGVADKGPGIPENERGKVFERFYRLNRSRSTPGSGLGLSLVAAVADLHGIELSLADNQPGLTVAMRFSVARPIARSLDP